MKRRWVQVPPSPRENLLSAVSAGLLGAGVGIAAFYFVRLFLAREPISGMRPEHLDRTPPPESGEDA